MTSRRGFLGAIAAALVLDPERALWVPGAKKIFLPPAPRPGLLVPPEVARAALFNVGDIVTFGADPQRFVCMNPGDATGRGATFSFLSGPGLPWGTNFPDKPAVVGSLPRRSAALRVHESSWGTNFPDKPAVVGSLPFPWTRRDRFLYRP